VSVELSKEDGIAGCDGAGDAYSCVGVEFAWTCGDYFSFSGAFF
jgi:hypothetical protein